LADEEQQFADIVGGWKSNPESLQSTLKGDDDIIALTRRLRRSFPNDYEVEAMIKNIDNIDSVIQVLRGKAQD